MPELYLIGAGVLFLLIYLLLRHHNAYAIKNGAVFTLFILLTTIGLVLMSLYHPNPFLSAFTIIALITAVLLVICSTFVLLIFLVIESIRLLKHEGRKLHNCLSLILLLLIIGGLIFNINAAGTYRHNWPSFLFGLVFCCELYLILAASSYLVSSALVLMDHPRKKLDYIVVLGCGLSNGRVPTPLLKGRIDKAILYANKPKLANPMLIMSGGQGHDEKVPEARAMKEYAMSRDFPEDRILTEEESKNTFENMKFSKALMDKRSENEYKCAFATNGYHVFRAGALAHKIGLKAKGIGAKTKLYYSQNALIREYMALLSAYKKVHLIAFCCLCAIYTGIYFYTFLYF